MTINILPSGEGSDSLDTDISRTLLLDDVLYELRFRWNTRDESWTIICSNVGGNPIFSTKAQVNSVFNDPYKHRAGCPQGNLVILDLSGDSGRVDFDNLTFDGRFRLFYNSVT